MSNPAFFVDGHQEQLIIQNLCPGKRVQRIGLNGDDVSILAIAKRLASLISLLGNRHYPIVILIDRETRIETSEEIKEALLIELINLGVVGQVIIGVPDRMIENWILADWDSFKEISDTTTSRRPDSFEGKKGKGQIKRFVTPYHETTDGVELFVNSNPLEIYKNSSSFSSFVDDMAGLECHWLSEMQTLE